MHLHGLTAAEAASDFSAADEAAPELDYLIRTEIREIGIPPRPAILNRIELEARSDDPDYDRLAELVSSDVGLAAALVKVANSPSSAARPTACSVSEALLALGAGPVVRAVADLASRQIFFHVPDLEPFWESAARTARASAWLAAYLKERSLISAEIAYTFGLFRDCGVAVLSIPFPEYAKLLDEAAGASGLCSTAAEDKLLSTDHATLGAALAEDWLLPEDVCLAIRRHHDAAALDEGRAGHLPDCAAQLVAIARLSDFLAGHGQPSIHREPPLMDAACMRLLRISAAELAHLQNVCRLSGRGFVCGL